MLGVSIAKDIAMNTAQMAREASNRLALPSCQQFIVVLLNIAAWP